MEKVKISILLLLVGVIPLSAQRIETLRFGDFEHWTVRHIRESSVLGGNVRTLYVVGPDETIDNNEVYDYRRTIWASSNAYATVMAAWPAWWRSRCWPQVRCTGERCSSPSRA